VKTAKIYVNDF